jgi:hypothetical protein
MRSMWLRLRYIWNCWSEYGVLDNRAILCDNPANLSWPTWPNTHLLPSLNKEVMLNERL